MSVDIPDTLESQIRTRYSDLSTTDRKLADTLIVHQNDVLSYSATELASLAGVSKASAARFFRRLGYEDYHAFRRHMRERVSQQSPLAQIDSAKKRRSANAEPNGLVEHLQRDAARLVGLPYALSDTDIDFAARRLARARQVWVMGFRNSYLAAFYAKSLLSQLRPSVRLLGDPSAYDAEWLADIQQGDVVFAVDLRRRTRHLSAMADAATSVGAELLLLTDSPVSALSACASAVLCCPRQQEQMFDSYVTSVSIVNYLMTQVASQLRKPARARLERIEGLHDLLQDLETDN